MGNLFFCKTFLSSVVSNNTGLGKSDSNIGQNDLVSNFDRWRDYCDSNVCAADLEIVSVVSNTKLVEDTETVDVIEESTEIVEDSTELEVELIEESVSEVESVVESEQSETDVPSVYSDQEVETYASSNDYYTYLPTWVDDYFEGVLQNIGDTDYIAYAYREYASNSSYNYTDYYYLVYDLDIENDVLQSGSYPCMIISRYGSTNGYSVNETVISSIPTPNIGYGSFGSYSDLRGGMGYVETYTILFAIGFAIVFGVVRGIFDVIFRLGKR